MSMSKTNAYCGSLLAIACLFAGINLLVTPADAETRLPSQVAYEATKQVPVRIFLVGANEPEEPEGTGPLAAYVLKAMNEWTKGRDAAPVTHKAEIARDLAWVAIEEKRIYDGSDGSREAVVLASIALHESRYRDYVDDASCNRWAAEAYQKTGMLNLSVLPAEAQKLMALGTCDGGIAVGIVQVHFECGSISILDDGGWQNGCSSLRTDPVRTVTKEMAMGDRRALLRIALAMARQSIRRGAGLAQYCGGEHAAEKGRERLGLAEAWSRSHPFTP